MVLWKEGQGVSLFYSIQKNLISYAYYTEKDDTGNIFVNTGDSQNRAWLLEKYDFVGGI